MHSFVQQNTIQPRILSRRLKRTLPRSNALRPSRNRQPHRRPQHPPGSNTCFFCFNFVSINFRRQEGVSWLKFVRRVVVCMYGHTYKKSMDQLRKVANPSCGQLTGKINISLYAFAPENLVSQDGFGSPVLRCRTIAFFLGLLTEAPRKRLWGRDGPAL